MLSTCRTRTVSRSSKIHRIFPVEWEQEFHCLHRKSSLCTGSTGTVSGSSKKHRMFLAPPSMPQSLPRPPRGASQCSVVLGRTSTHRNQCIETRSPRTTQLRRYYCLRDNLVATGSNLEQVRVAALESLGEQVLVWEQRDAKCLDS